MACDPVKGLVQVPCVEPNGFGAIKAYTAASPAIRGGGDHFMPLDSLYCRHGADWTEDVGKVQGNPPLGGLALGITEC
jgi:L-serine dehydratase